MDPAQVSGETTLIWRGQPVEMLVLVGADVQKGMSGAPAVAPVPTNHMSELGWVQLKVPIPEAVACSASKPSAIWPLAATAVPP